DRVHDLHAPAVVERDVESHARVRAGQSLRLLHLLQHAPRDPPVSPSREHDAHAAVVQLVPTTAEERPVEVHEESHLVSGASPVLRGEPVHRQPREADLERALHGVEQRLLPHLVALGAGQPSLTRPPAVPVHDDPDVPRDPRKVEIGEEAHGRAPLRASNGRLRIRRSRWYSTNPYTMAPAALPAGPSVTPRPPP